MKPIAADRPRAEADSRLKVAQAQLSLAAARLRGAEASPDGAAPAPSSQHGRTGQSCSARQSGAMATSSGPGQSVAGFSQQKIMMVAQAPLLCTQARFVVPAFVAPYGLRHAQVRNLRVERR